MKRSRKCNIDRTINRNLKSRIKFTHMASIILATFENTKEASQCTLFISSYTSQTRSLFLYSSSSNDTFCSSSILCFPFRDCHKEITGIKQSLSSTPNIIILQLLTQVIASVVQWSEFLDADPEVSDSIPGATIFSEYQWDWYAVQSAS
jgi:hypothetical protein